MDLAFSYDRFSTKEQRKGDSLRRQTEARNAWCQRNNCRLDTHTTYQDLGTSAFLGEHRKNPDRHALAAFLRLVEDDKIPRGSYLIIESLDRLTREHVRAGLMLCLGLIEKGIKIVQLSPSEIIYDDKSDEMSLMLMIVELSRGHNESKRKSDLIGPAWRRKKESARDGQIVTDRLPHWIEIKDGKLALIEDRAATIRLIFGWSGAGYGLFSIVQKLTRDGVPCFGKTSKWGKSYVGKILRDRRAIGEYQPRKGKKRVPDGDPVKGYFPPVVSEEEYHTAQAGASQRGKYRGRIGTQEINVFAGLIHNSREGDSYFMTSRNQCGKKYHVLINCNCETGRSGCFSFSYPVFERAILSKLAELNPAEILGKDSAADEARVLSGEWAVVVSRIAQYEAELAAGGEIPSLARALRVEEDRRRDLTARLKEATQRAANPASEAWGEAQSLVAVLEGAADRTDARLRLRSALRRIIREIWLLVVPVPRSMLRLAAVQVKFESGQQREYFIAYRPPHNSFAGRSEAVTVVKSATGYDGELDLSKPEQVPVIEASLIERFGKNKA